MHSSIIADMVQFVNTAKLKYLNGGVAVKLKGLGLSVFQIYL